MQGPSNISIWYLQFSKQLLLIRHSLMFYSVSLAKFQDYINTFQENQKDEEHPESYSII
jgi:hypothetical protein